MPDDNHNSESDGDEQTRHERAERQAEQPGTGEGLLGAGSQSSFTSAALSNPQLTDGGPQDPPSYPNSLLGNPLLNGRGNGPVRIAVTLEAQQIYGNRAVQRLVRGSAGSVNPARDGSIYQAAVPDTVSSRQTTSTMPSVQRSIKDSILGSDKTEEQKVKDALQSKDPSDVRDIKNVNAANQQQKLDLIHILAYQGWVDIRDEYKIEEFWRSFGDDVIQIMPKNEELWNKCIEGGADLDKLPAVKKAQLHFMTDVQALAMEYLKKNRAYVADEMKSIGLDGAPQTPEADKKLKEIQEMAAQVKVAQEKDRGLRQLVVGAELVPDGGWWHEEKFDPDKPPRAKFFRNTSKDEVDFDRDWKATYAVWKPVADFITKVANEYPSIYGAVQQSQKGDLTLFGTPDDKVAAIADEKNPAKAREIIGTVMKEVLKNINESEGKISGGEAKYLKFMPLHAQLFEGARPAASGTDWSKRFNRWVADNDLKTEKSREFWLDLGLKSAGMAAFVVAELATAGTATFFVAAGIGLAASGYKAVDSVEKYMELDKAAKSTVKDSTALVDRATVTAAGKKAVDDAAAFIAMATALGVKAATESKSKAGDKGAPESGGQKSIPQLTKGPSGKMLGEAVGKLKSAPPSERAAMFDDFAKQINAADKGWSATKSVTPAGDTLFIGGAGRTMVFDPQGNMFVGDIQDPSNFTMGKGGVFAPNYNNLKPIK